MNSLHQQQLVLVDIHSEYKVKSSVSTVNDLEILILNIQSRENRHKYIYYNLLVTHLLHHSIILQYMRKIAYLNKVGELAITVDNNAVYIQLHLHSLTVIRSL
jgi:hypothetical protein